MNYIVSLVFDKQREWKERPEAVGARSSLESERISHVFTIDTLLVPTAWSL